MAGNFLTTKIDLQLKDVSGEERHYTSVRSLFTMLKKEQAFWNNFVSTVPGNSFLNQINSNINAAFNSLNTVQQNFPNWDEATQESQLQQSLSNIRALYSQHIIFSDTPFAGKFQEVCELGPQQAQAFWTHAIQPSTSGAGISDIGTLQGAILAYEFRFQEESAIAKRKDTEKRSITALRRSLADKTDEIIRTADEFQGKMLTDSQSFKDELTEWKSTTEADLASKLEEDQASRDAFIEDGNKRLQDLEKLYADKLKLEKPAEYWNKQAQKHKETGEKWAKALILSTALSAFVFISLFVQWLSSGKNVDKLSSMHWQGVVLLGAVLSLSIFIIKTFSRLTFSSFHLKQDAEEREQFAYFYLALGHETEIDVDSRKIVFQSLFSRAESGLLSAEHGPTMPITEMAKQIRPGQ